VNVPSKSVEPKNFIKKTILLLESCQPLTKKKDPDPNPNLERKSVVRMSRIHNTTANSSCCHSKSEQGQYSSEPMPSLWLWSITVIHYSQNTQNTIPNKYEDV
jgi:hypothetical protein